jgi:beta-N-acetylhexosaminidase
MSELERLALAVLQPGFDGVDLPAAYGDLLADGLGGICLFGSNTAAGPDRVTALCAAIHAAHPGAVVAVDEEGGDVTRLHDREGSPVLGAAALGVLDDPAATRATGAAVGAELAAVGIDLTLAPVADVNSNPDNPVIGTRSFGATPEAVATHVTAWLRGAQGAGVAACVKHFPGHGDTAADSHLTLPVLSVDEQQLTVRELVPFAAAVEAGVAAVMTSHIVVPALDPERPATLSAPVLARLRDLGFTGAVVTDALDMAGVAEGRTMGEAAVLALAAGADVLSLGPGRTAAEVRAVQASLVDAVETGRVTEARLVEAAGRAAALRRTSEAPEVDEGAHGGRGGPPRWSRRAASVVEEGRLRPVTRPGPSRDRSAAGSLRVEGTLPPLAGARVVTVHTPASIAVGDVPWGLPADAEITEDGAEDPRPGAGVPLVVQVRDLHRHAWAEAVVRRLAATVPVVLVEWGWPGRWDGEVPRIRTHGWSRPGAAALRELLREAGWDR